MGSKYVENIDYELLDRKIVYNGKRVVVEELNYYNPRKQQKVYREHVIVEEAAIIIPITKDNEFIMIKEPRTPIGKTVLAFPAGIIEKNENPEYGAIRELEEETGYRAHSIKKIKELYPTIGYSTEKTLFFIAKDLEKTERHLDETEDIEVVKIPIEEAKRLLENNEIVTSSETVALLYYFQYEQNSETENKN